MLSIEHVSQVACAHLVKRWQQVRTRKIRQLQRRITEGHYAIDSRKLATSLFLGKNLK